MADRPRSRLGEWFTSHSTVHPVLCQILLLLKPWQINSRVCLSQEVDLVVYLHVPHADWRQNPLKSSWSIRNLKTRLRRLCGVGNLTKEFTFQNRNFFQPFPLWTPSLSEVVRICGNNSRQPPCFNCACQHQSVLSRRHEKELERWRDGACCIFST